MEISKYPNREITYNYKNHTVFIAFLHIYHGEIKFFYYTPDESHPRTSFIQKLQIVQLSGQISELHGISPLLILLSASSQTQFINSPLDVSSQVFPASSSHTLEYVEQSDMSNEVKSVSGGSHPRTSDKQKLQIEQSDGHKSGLQSS